MKIDEARKLIAGIEAAIAKAEAEGRDTLRADDIEHFVSADDTARIALVDAIRRAEK